MTKLYLEHTQTGKRYDIVKYDAETKVAVLKGPLGREFTEELDKDRMTRLGYTLQKGE